MMDQIQSPLKLDKSGWFAVRFGDVVFEPKETVKDPVVEGVEHVVGLEHIDSENIHLQRSASIEESTTFTKKFAVGDVLFGRRRAYLKKAAQASFEGICSGDITVFRAKDNLLPELLPFIVMNEQFFDYAIKHSAGGLSPRVKFKDLASYEFLLPPKAQQAELAELLWAMDEVIEKASKVHERLDQLFKVKANLISNLSYKDSELYRIKELCNIKDNLRVPLNSKQREKMVGDIPYYGANGRVGNVNKSIFDEDLVLLAEDGGNFSEFYTKEIAYKVTGKSWVNNHAHVLSIKDSSCSIDWLHFSLSHKNITKHIIGTTRVKLNKSDLENIKIWVPPEDIRIPIEKEMLILTHNRQLAKAKLVSSKGVNKSLINQVFS